MTSFTLEGRVLKLNSAADAAPVVAELEALDASALVEIVFSGSTFGVEAARAVAQALKRMAALEVANLSDIFTGRLKDEIPMALDAFVDAFVDKKHFKVIDLSDNAFGPIGAAPIRRLFIENRSITTLKLNNNGLGIEGGRLIATSLVDAAKATTEKLLTNMHTIIMGRNRLETVAARHFADLALPILPNLKELRMPQNGIRPEGIQVLIESLAKNCPQLEVLDLQDNTFTKPGSKSLARALPSWPHLRHLNIGDCLLGKSGSKTFMKSLHPPCAPKLETLIFTFNEMDLEGAKLVPGMLANKVKLHTLWLNGNVFDAEEEVVDLIRGVMRGHGHVDGLDELEDMEEVDSDAEEEEESEEEVEVEVVLEVGEEKKKDDVDALADALGGVKV
ncbi:hypothetical protein HDU98_007748 [Podochytrium sp. JEL0797]|nr:hypothetical protein HDU98_007748 [Podochytrium sp. JEL0797]